MKQRTESHDVVLTGKMVAAWHQLAKWSAPCSTRIMKSRRSAIHAIGLGITFLTFQWVSAESLPSSQGKSGARPMFHSKIHVPVQLAEPATPLPPSGYQLVFEDEFNGDKLDTNRWNYRTGSRLLSTQNPENVSVGDGTLKIALRKESAAGKDYTGGGVISRNTFIYGFYEARFKTPGIEGWHTSFWAQKHAAQATTNGSKALLELDFCEQDGGDPNYYSFGIINKIPNFHKGQTWNAGRWVIEHGPDTSADFHVWACEFTPNTIRFYFDGRLAREENATNFPHDDMNVWLTSLASTLKGDRWVDDSKLPGAAVFDYVRVYQNPNYRDAEAAVRAATLQRAKPPKSDRDHNVGGPKNLN
jgi:beta-glucanase (GH16 family)